MMTKIMCNCGAPRSSTPSASIFTANQAQSTAVFDVIGSRGKDCSLDLKASSLSERPGFPLYHLVTFLDSIFVYCFVVRVSPQESVH